MDGTGAGALLEKAGGSKKAEPGIGPYRRMALRSARPMIARVALRSHPPPGRVRAKGEGEIMQTRSLLLGVAIGLFGALAVLTARYVAIVLAG
jgi:hypothetical protein